jgi:hypothetical protein
MTGSRSERSSAMAASRLGRRKTRSPPSREADPAFRPPRARITQDPQAQSALPNRHRRPHQPPRARLPLRRTRLKAAMTE